MEDRPKFVMDFPRGQIEVYITFDKVSPGIYWENRHTLFQNSNGREEAFDKMAYEDRELITSRVKEALERLYDNVEDWLPEAFKEFDPGNRITLEVSMLVIDHDRAIDNNQKRLSFKVRNAMHELEEELHMYDEEQ